MSESPGSVTVSTLQRNILPHAVPSVMLSARAAAAARRSACGERRRRRRRHPRRHARRRHARRRHPRRRRGGGGRRRRRRRQRAGCAGGRRRPRGWERAHFRCSGARRSWRALRSTRSPICGAAGSCSRSGRAWLRAVSAELGGSPSRNGRGGAARTFPLPQRLEGGLVAQQRLPRLHHQREARVDALDARLLLLAGRARAFEHLARLAAVLGRGLRGGGRTFLPRSILGVRKSGLCADDAVLADTRSSTFTYVVGFLHFQPGVCCLGIPLVGGGAHGAAEPHHRLREVPANRFAPAFACRLACAFLLAPSCQLRVERQAIS